jgi:hypothetical protein
MCILGLVCYLQPLGNKSVNWQLFSGWLILFWLEHVCVPFSDMHQKSEKQKCRPHQGRRSTERLFVKGVALHIERILSAQGTVASPSPVAGSDVAIGPLLMLKLDYPTLQVGMA